MVSLLSESAIVADAAISPRLDRLYLRPRGELSHYALKAFLEERLPQLPRRQRTLPDGLAFSPFEAPFLLHESVEHAIRWSAEARRYAENRRQLSQRYDAHRRGVLELLREDLSAAMGRLSGFRLLGMLDPHQVRNVVAMTAADGHGICLFDEQGTGKTVSMLAAFDLLAERDECDLLFIVAPKSMVPEWKRDADRFLGGLYDCRLVTGSRTEKLTALWSPADVLVTNFETPMSLEGEITALFDQKRGRVALAIDESFYAKNLDARRTQAIRRIREGCRRAFVLCGTPSPNAPQDLVQQFNIVDFGWTFDSLEIPEDRQTAAIAVRRAMSERGLYLRSRKYEVLSLPGRQTSRVLLSLASQQEQLYEELRAGLLRDLQATDEEGFRRQLAHFLARRSALLQVCSHPAAVYPGYLEIPAKVAALDDLLEDLVGRRREKIVLWSFYTRTIDVLAQRYASFGLVRYDGAVPDVATRRNAVERFQNDDETMVFLANPAAAGAGLTLHRARIAVFESFSNQAAHYLQSLDRIHRRGQQRNVESIVLLCQGTIEVAEYERLVRKERDAQDLMGDTPLPAVSRGLLLRELLERS